MEGYGQAECSHVAPNIRNKVLISVFCLLNLHDPGLHCCGRLWCTPTPKPSGLPRDICAGGNTIRVCLQCILGLLFFSVLSCPLWSPSLLLLLLSPPYTFYPN